MDFEDLLLLTWKLLRDYPEALNSIRSRYRHILVDEYQDTNTPQYAIIRLLADKPPAPLIDYGNQPPARSLFVVGDINQAIYSWRGAVPENINTLLTDFPAVQTYKLYDNYRSVKSITCVANDIIGNEVKKSKALLSPHCNPVTVVETANDDDQAFYIVNKLLKLKTIKKSVAVLYRTNAQSRAIEVSSARIVSCRL